jgi:excisionase family DNA binding protein
MEGEETKRSLTVKEAAAFLCVGRDMIYQWIKDGLPHYKLGNRFCFVVSDLIDWREKYRVVNTWK